MFGSINGIGRRNKVQKISTGYFFSKKFGSIEKEIVGTNLLIFFLRTERPELCISPRKGTFTKWKPEHTRPGDN